MSHYSDSPGAERISESAPDLSSEEVRTYLMAHPELIADDAELIAAILPPSRVSGRNVVDMQQFVIGKLQSQVRTLRDIQSELIEASSLNSLAREQVHMAALSLLDARDFGQFIEYVTSPDGLARVLGIRAAAFCIESEHGVVSIGSHVLRVLEPGGVARIMGGNDSFRLSANVRGSRGLYGHLADEVRSEALVRLDFSPASPPGLLALGGEAAEQFHPDQAADLLEFLARIVERCVRRWLDLPPNR